MVFVAWYSARKDSRARTHTPDFWLGWGRGRLTAALKGRQAKDPENPRADITRRSRGTSRCFSLAARRRELCIRKFDSIARADFRPEVCCQYVNDACFFFVCFVYTQEQMTQKLFSKNNTLNYCRFCFFVFCESHIIIKIPWLNKNWFVRLIEELRNLW